MKAIYKLGIAISILIFSCTKSTDDSSKIKKSEPKKWYRIAAIGNDTTYSRAMNARGESQGIVFTENQQLRAEIMSYHSIGNGIGEYKIRMTNKQTCKGFLRWNWEQINPTSIEPDDNTAGTGHADVLTGSEVKYYTMIAKATVGALLVKFEKYGDGSCNNSSTLRLNITLNVLPVKFISCEAYRDRNKDYDLFINFTIETPEDANVFEIQESEDGANYHTINTTVSDKKTKVYSIRIPNK